MKKTVVNKKNKNKNPLIEVLKETANEQGQQQHEGNEQQQQQEEEIKQAMENLNINQKFSYGFQDQYSEFFQDLEEEILEIGELNPDNISKKDRIQMREQILLENFDEEHYLFDLFDNEEEIQEKLYMELELTKNIQNEEQNSKDKKLYDEKEWDTLVKLPNKEFIIENKNELFMQMVDISFAYLYELRSFDDELTCESAASINKVSSVLSCFIVDDNIASVISQSYKRALTYPLYRHFELCQLVRSDVAKVFRAGKINVLKLFLRLKNVFEVSEPRYLLNRLYIEDFCVAIQHFSDEEIKEIGKQLASIQINKNTLEGLQLVKLEKGAEIVMEGLEKQPATEAQQLEAKQIQQKAQKLEEKDEFPKQQQKEQVNKPKVLIEEIQSTENQDQEENSNQQLNLDETD